MHSWQYGHWLPEQALQSGAGFISARATTITREQKRRRDTRLRARTHTPYSLSAL